MADIKLKLTKTDSTEYEINRFNGLKSVESLSQSTPNYSKIKYGICENTGSFSIVDSDKTLYNMITNGSLSGNLVPVKIYANGKKITEGFSNNSNYSLKDYILSSDFNQDKFNEKILSKRLKFKEQSLYDFAVDNIFSKGYYNDSYLGCQRFFTNSNDIITITGDTTSTLTTLNTNETYTYINENKYFCYFYAKLSTANYRVRITFPSYESSQPIYSDNVDSLYSDNVGEDWTLISGFLYPHFYSQNRQQKMSLELRNYNNNITCQIKNINIINLTQNDLLDKDLAWCNANLTKEWITNIDNQLSNTIIYGNTTGTVKDYLKAIEVSHGVLYQDTKRNQINKICEIAQLNAYEDENSNLKFISARPIETSSNINNTIVIPRNKQYSYLSPNILDKIKYNNTKYTNIKLKISEDSEVVYSSKFEVYDDNENFVGTDTTNINKEFSSVGVSTFGTAISGTGNMGISLSNPLRKQTDKKIVPSDFDNTDCFAKITKTYTGGLSETITIAQLSSSSSIQYDKFSYNISEDGNESINFFIQVRFASSTGHLITKQKVASFYIEIYKKTYSIEETKIQTNGNSNVYEIESNELLQEDTTYNSTPMATIISNNIISDYSSGIMSGNLTISCDNYYTINGTLSKNFRNGDIINVGDIVRVDKDNSGTSLFKDSNNNDIYWRVVGRKFRYKGCPYIDLEVQQVKFI